MSGTRASTKHETKTQPKALPELLPSASTSAAGMCAGSVRVASSRPLAVAGARTRAVLGPPIRTSPKRPAGASSSSNSGRSGGSGGGGGRGGGKGEGGGGGGGEGRGGSGGGGGMQAKYLVGPMTHLYSSPARPTRSYAQSAHPPTQSGPAASCDASPSSEQQGSMYRDSHCSLSCALKPLSAVTSPVQHHSPRPGSCRLRSARASWSAPGSRQSRAGAAGEGGGSVHGTPGGGGGASATIALNTRGAAATASGSVQIGRSGKTRARSSSMVAPAAYIASRSTPRSRVEPSVMATRPR
mmetsp:Transcript_20322/g.61889  ORF Transcript_20322/g.61889 Transcript_20322/m.61889 type:complete len:298 (+) Transcript_20322:706-1599(+)